MSFSLNPIDWVTDAIDSAAGSVLDAMVSWIEDGLKYVTQQIGQALAGVSSPDFGSGAFAQLGGTFKWLALATVTASIVLSCAGALLNPRVELMQVLREIPLTMLMLAGWYLVAAMWFGVCAELTGVFTGDALSQALTAGLSLDPGIASFFRLLIALFMIMFLIVFLVEMFVLQHMLTMAAIVGPLSIALRPWPAMKDVSSKMVRNLASMSLTPALTAASMSLALQNINQAGVLDIGRAIGGLAGMVVSVLMPLMISRFIPFGGSADGGGRALLGAAAATAGTAAGIASGVGAGAVAAGGIGRLFDHGSKS